MNRLLKTPLLAIVLPSLGFLSSCTISKPHPLPPQAQRVSAPGSASSPSISAPEQSEPLRASGHCTGMTLFGFIKLSSASTEKARASLYSSIGRDVSDTTITLQKQTIQSSERNFFIFSLRNVHFDAEVVRNVPSPIPTADPSELSGAPLRHAVPVFPSK